MVSSIYKWTVYFFVLFLELKLLHLEMLLFVLLDTLLIDLDCEYVLSMWFFFTYDYCDLRVPMCKKLFKKIYDKL